MTLKSNSRPSTPRAGLSRRAVLGGAAATAAGLGLAACAPGGGTSPQGQSAPASVQTNTSKISGSITVMDTWTDKTSLQAKWMIKVQSDFMAKYPDVKITRTSQTFDDVNKTLKLKLSDPSTPDIVPANNGWQGIGTFAKAGLILNLDSYAKAYGWATRIPETIAKQHQVTPDGSQIGTGSFFGIPMAQGGFITVYYNRAKFDKLGVTPPQTFDEFTALLAKAKSAGEIPMMIGTQDQWLSTTTLFAVMNVYATKDKIADFVYGIGGSAADTGMKEAATIYQQWAKSGYLPDNFAGTSGADSGTKFVEGQGVLYAYYSDSLPFKDSATASKFGTFLIPTQGDLHATGASNQNFSIATRSKNHDAAALFLDYISSTAAGDTAMATGIMPFIGNYTAPADAGPLLTDEIDELTACTKTDGFVPYFDWSSPTMLDTLGAQTQLLLAGKITPDKLVEECQSDYDKFRASQGK